MAGGRTATRRICAPALLERYRLDLVLVGITFPLQRWDRLVHQTEVTRIAGRCYRCWRHVIAREVVVRRLGCSVRRWV